MKNFYDCAIGKKDLFAEGGRTIPNMTKRHESTQHLMVLMFQN